MHKYLAHHINNSLEVIEIQADSYASACEMATIVFDTTIDQLVVTHVGMPDLAAA